MRYGAAAATAIALAWTFLGDDLVILLLTETFGPVHRASAILMVAFALTCCGATCFALLYIRHLAGSGFLVTLVTSVLTLAALLWVVWATPEEGMALRIAWIFTASAALFWLLSHLALGRRGEIWLPVLPTLGLLVPALLSPIALSWQSGFAVDVVVCTVAGLVYLVLAVVLRWLPLEEILELAGTLRSLLS
jgi:hypothetical protein